MEGSKARGAHAAFWRERDRGYADYDEGSRSTKSNSAFRPSSLSTFLVFNLVCLIPDGRTE